MVERDAAAQARQADGHGCRCGAHTITPACPVGCLRAVLSAGTFNPLSRAYGARFAPPRTAGDVVELYLQHRLTDIGGIGRRRIGEIGISLRYAGLIGAGSHEHHEGQAPGRQAAAGG